MVNVAYLELRSNIKMAEIATPRLLDQIWATPGHGSFVDALKSFYTKILDGAENDGTGESNFHRR